MKATDKMKELRGMGVDELKTSLANTERELLNLRFRQAAGQLEQNSQLNALRRVVARTRTVLVEKNRAEQGN